jgi:hypothetical protein
MSDPYRPIDLERIKTYPLAERGHRVRVEGFARPVASAGSLASFLDGLSDYLGARTLRELARTIVAARRAHRPVVWALGGHVVKVGLSPVLIELMEGGTLTGLALNGAAAIHDWEIAAIGATSEDVEEGLDRGRFGLAEETGAEFDAAAREARDRSQGLGESLGRRILESARPHREVSLLAAARRLGLAATVHVAIGSDTVHQHPRADGAAIGAAALTDFRRLVAVVGELSGGVWVNCGSAVQLPEVFLKALAVARNLGLPEGPFSTANLDMQRHYRTEQNVLRRPTRGGGAAFSLLGHHEINVPLLAAAIQLEQGRIAGDG